MAGPLLAGLLAALALPTALPAQEGADDPSPDALHLHDEHTELPAGHPGGEESSYPFAPPVGSPLEPATRLAPVRVKRGDRQRWVGLADLGDRIPFWISGREASPGGLQVAGAVAGGAFSRFDLEGRSNEFIEIHYRAALQALGRWRGLEFRAELYHVSSHLGDDFLLRTGSEPISTSREGVEVLVDGRVAESLRLYGGPGFVLRSTRDFDSPSIRAGLEWRPAGPTGPVTPYVASDLFSWSELGWDPMLSGEAGIAFAGEHLRLSFTAGTGPSRAEQFFRERETLWGFVFSARR